MTRALKASGYLVVGCVVLLFTTATVHADEKDKGKGKGKDEKPNVIQIDVSKLPPDLAKALQKHALNNKEYNSEGKKPNPTPKGPPMTSKAPATAAQLPPGLASKPADHPGRVAWLKEHSGAPSAPPTTAPKGTKGKGDDLENRLNRLLIEVEELRKEMRKK